MATVRTSCPDCGDLELTHRDLTVRVCAEDRRGTYVFTCPSCNMAVTKPAESRIVDLLVSSGVELVVWSPPLELREPRPTGERFTHDDLLKLHDLLLDESWLEQLCNNPNP